MQTPEQEPKTHPSAFGISTRGAILLIVLTALVLRVWGLDFGLPQTFHPDEPIVVTRALYSVASGDWNPKAFHWPSLQFYILGLEYEVWYLYGRLSGDWSNADPEFISYSLHFPGGFYYLGRFTTALFGIGCVWLTFLLSRRFFRDPAAIAAAAVMAMHPIVTRHSRFITPDIPSEFFFLAAVLLLDRLFVSLENSRRPAPGDTGSNFYKFAFASAVMVGLGAGTKYHVGVLALPLMAVVLITPSGLKFMSRIGIAVALGVTCLVVFFITTPFALLDFPKFRDDLQIIGWHLQDKHIGMEAYGGMWMSSLRTLIKDCGWSWIIVGALSSIWFLFKKPRRTWPLIFAFALPLIGLSQLNVYADRYLIPVIPLFALGIGLLVDYLLSVTEKQTKWKGIYRVLILIGFLLVSFKGISVLATDAHRLTLPDTREYALVWVEEYIPHDSRILVEQGGPDLNDSSLAPLVPEPSYWITDLTPLFFRGGGNKDPLDELVEARPEWVITSSEVRYRYMRPSAEEEYPDLVAVFRIYYRLIEMHLAEEERWTPGPGLMGPELVIYRVPEGLWDRVQLDETTIESVLENTNGTHENHEL